jgi:hypothetical protein
MRISAPLSYAIIASEPWEKDTSKVAGDQRLVQQRSAIYVHDFEVESVFAEYTGATAHFQNVIIEARPHFQNVIIEARPTITEAYFFQRLPPGRVG